MSDPRPPCDLQPAHHDADDDQTGADGGRPAVICRPAAQLLAMPLAAVVLVTGIGLTALTGGVIGVRATAEPATHAKDALHGLKTQLSMAQIVGVLDRRATDRADRSFRGPLWRSPLHRYVITATFGQAGGRWRRDHTGLDFAATVGTPVYAVSDGEIVAAKRDGAYGNQVRIRHTDGTESWYCHLSGFTATGGTVHAGQLIGYVGTTGNSTGPHLHLEIRRDNMPLDPLAWLRSKGVPV